MQEKNIEIQNLEINKENLENNLKQSISTRSLNNKNNINNIYNLSDNNNSNINLSKYNSDRNFKNRKPPLNNYITKLRNQFEPSVKIQDRTYEVYNTNY